MTDIEKTIAIAQILSVSMNSEGYYPDAYGAMRIADAAMSKGLTTRDERQQVGPQYTDSYSLVEYIRDGDDITAWCIRSFVANSKKIHAIKVLRSVAGVGLKEAKDAVETYAGTLY